jgi:arsenite oxidase large subunit
MTSSKNEASANLNSVPLPPPDARVVNTVCDYCIVGCSQKAIVWPVGEQGGVNAKANAYGVDFPVEQLTGQWVSPNQHSYCLVDGKKHHVVVHPDDSATVVNTLGNHSIRGGCIAQKVYNPEGLTKDRLQKPLLRVGGRLVPVSWDLALDVMVEVSRHILDKFGEAAWGMKTFSYQYFENTYAISKLAFESIQTPAYAPHDKPGPGNDTAGADDAGFQVFSASYDDWAKSEVIFISGCDPYETKTVLFTEWMMGANRKLILVLPRKTTGAAYAEKNGGLFLQIVPGTDTILHLALIRLILENGWEDKAFVEKWVANRWEIDAGFGRGTRNTPWQWRTTWGKFGAAPDEYRKWILSYPEAELDAAGRITGIPAEKIRRAAEMIARPQGDRRPKTSFALEKGNYWSNNYLNTASYATLALFCGAGNREGRVFSRLGGHQRGWYGAASYPRILSPEKAPGRRRKEIDLDRWVVAGKLRFAWVIGTTWIQSMAASQELERSFRRLTRDSQHQIQEADAVHAAEVLKRRADEGGMVVVDQDIYLRQPIGGEFADIVLPVATWGEHDFTRANGERRLRLYGKFCDPPGEARPDWWVIAQFARKMGFKDYDWKDSNDVFEQAARSGRRGVLNYHPLVVYAKRAGMTGHELLRKLGSTGIQTPVRFRTRLTESDEYRAYAGCYEHPEVRGAIIGTKRLHDVDTPMGDPEGPTMMMKWMTAFNTHSGKGILHKTPWELFADFYARITPRNDEFWVTSGRINEVWQTYFDDFRKPFIRDRWPEQWVEVHPDDAARLGIESGDWVRVVNDDVLVQTGGFVAVEPDDQSFSRLLEKGLIHAGHGEFKGVALVTDAVRPGVLWTNSLHPGSPANSVVHRVPDPITNRYRFKLGKGKLERIGESEYKKDLRRMSFAPRTII